MQGDRLGEADERHQRHFPARGVEYPNQTTRPGPVFPRDRVLFEQLGEFQVAPTRRLPVSFLSRMRIISTEPSVVAIT